MVTWSHHYGIVVRQNIMVGSVWSCSYTHTHTHIYTHTMRERERKRPGSRFSPQGPNFSNEAPSPKIQIMNLLMDEESIDDVRAS
jgi:hypothetical protein